MRDEIFQLAALEAKFSREALLDLPGDAPPDRRIAAQRRAEEARRRYDAAFCTHLQLTGRIPR